MDKKERMIIRAAAEWQSALKRGGKSVSCFFCGEARRYAFEVHHIARSKFGEEAIALCVACHRELTERQTTEHPPDGPDPTNPLEKKGRQYLGVADLLECITDLIRRDGEDLIEAAKKQQRR